MRISSSTVSVDPGMISMTYSGLRMQTARACFQLVLPWEFHELFMFSSHSGPHSRTFSYHSASVQFWHSPFLYLLRNSWIMFLKGLPLIPRASLSSYLFSFLNCFLAFFSSGVSLLLWIPWGLPPCLKDFIICLMNFIGSWALWMPFDSS